MTIHGQRIAATRNSIAAPEVVLLHGWGMSSAVWQPWLPLLREHCNITLLDLPGYSGSNDLLEADIDALLTALAEVVPARAFYVGYSLGGMLATQLALRFPARVTGLVTFASNARFIAGADWPWAMPQATFEAFYQGVSAPAVMLKRFAGLQVHGCSEEKALLKMLRRNQQAIAPAALRQSLDWLRAIDNSRAIRALTVPARFCFAENDALVPIAAADHFPPASTVVVSGAAHAMFLSHPRQCLDVVLDLLGRCSLAPSPVAGIIRNKQDVARSFGRAAPTYDSVADLQRRVGGALLETLPAKFSAAEGAVVDLGCGTGFFLEALRQRFPQHAVVGIDLSEGMLNYAAEQRGHRLLLCGDAENLPLAEQSVALVFSSLTIQWCENIEALLAEVFRVLVPGGLFVFSTLGPDTLSELREAWRRVDDYVHVNRFVDEARLEKAMGAAGFVDAVAPVTEQVVLEYDNVLSLARELKSLGAHNVNSGRPAGLTPRQRLAQLTENYEQFRSAGGQLPATYQVWYGALSKGEPQRG